MAQYLRDKRGRKEGRGVGLMPGFLAAGFSLAVEEKLKRPQGSGYSLQGGVDCHHELSLLYQN